MRRARVRAGFAGDRRTVSPIDIGGGEMGGLRPSRSASKSAQTRECGAQRGDQRGLLKTRAGFDAGRGIIQTLTTNLKTEVECPVVNAIRLGLKRLQFQT
jgi:hypothetical protein